MIKNFFFIILFIFFSLTFISSQEITFYNLTINNSNVFCLGEISNIKIIPLNVDGSFTNVSSINYTLGKNFKTNGIIFSIDKYEMNVFLDDKLVETKIYNMSFTAEQ